MKKAAKLFTCICLLAFSFCAPGVLVAQTKPAKETELVYIDGKGVLRWKKNNQEAAFFGVNYTVPFAYGYRSVKARGMDPEKAIDQDVYHLARLGLDAFRVHVWDTEISDTLGNLLENEHLRLFDYLVYKLKQRNIRIMLTPIAFWGNGYPEKDEATPGFSHLYGKKRALVEERAFVAQENYLRQFLNHVNPYTKLTYGADANIIGAEVNNEPQHSGPKARTTEYVNRMVAAIRATGWTKPVYYNISESPTYADAVAKAQIDGVSFQWYPTGLVANHTLQGNYLPHVDRYQIPFDTIPEFKNKSLMVYEFDAGDVLGSYMYPAMAKSFRQAGMQWATQFAYDPLATAYGNTEYQTHYLNLAYTPDKAISLLIASKAFHALPLRKNFGTYPADSVFGAFRVSYAGNLSEMNTAQEFYYSNTTSTKPVNAKKLAHVAGVGTSPVVRYSGTGAYFLDKLENGVWRLEVMPDAVHIRDPFAKASPGKEVTRIQWQIQDMQINLPELGNSFTITAVNEGNQHQATAKGGSFQIQPGAYLLSKKVKSTWTGDRTFLNLQVKEFVAPQPFDKSVFVDHQPITEVSSGKAFTLKAQIVGVSPGAKVTVQANNLAGVFKTIGMEKAGAYDFTAQLPVDLLTPGLVTYRIMVQEAGRQITFPGGHEGDPWAWDNYRTDSYQVFVAAAQGQLELFNATHDRALNVFPNLWRSDERQLITGQKTGQLILQLTAKELPKEGTFGFQHAIADKLKGRQPELASFDKLVVRIRTSQPKAVPVTVALVNKNASAFTAQLQVANTFQNIEVPLSSLRPGAFMLLPRPYPGFHPFWFKSEKPGTFSLQDLDKLQIYLTEGTSVSGPITLEIESVWLEKKKQ
ncbi:membrane or secreted protein [Rufibacter radiotolerans]|uniref:Membrane or secreted protein n=1 Tax=Rufibacter radiotolerans TaxID=1379910 RepID=A0A0H4VJ03_9BACT|nr:membrane or secreted protein [Rufibacter radiotolerans]AKQ45795.1 membrane or secreted protein [Rufibacter radiotolerans]